MVPHLKIGWGRNGTEKLWISDDGALAYGRGGSMKSVKEELRNMDVHEHHFHGSDGLSDRMI